MISSDDRRNPLKHLTDTSGNDYPSKTIEVLYEYSQRGERGCAELLLKRFKDETLDNHDTKKWLKYDNAVWVKDSISNITWRSQKFLLEVFPEVARLAEGQEFRLKQLARDDSDNEQELKREASRYKKYAQSFDKTKKAITYKKTSDQIIALLATEEDIGTATTDFDQHPLLINLQNGYYDLEQAQFYDSDPKKRFLCQFRTNYIPEAKPEKWIKFLETIFEGDQERIE